MFGPFVWMLVVAGCASRPVTSAERMSARRPLYAITAPSAEELAAFTTVALGGRDEGRVEHHNGIDFRYAEIASRRCLLFVTGMSLVNAAMSTQMALDRFPITHFVILGAAGGVNPAREPGDVVIPERWAYHGEATYLNPRPDGLSWEIPAGYASSLPNFGMMFPERVSVARSGASGSQPMDDFPADPGLLAAATKVSSEHSNEVLGGRWPRMIPRGIGVSGSALVANREYRVWLYQTWQAEIVDLESTAVAQVCWANRVPFVSVRAVVGLAGGGSPGRNAMRPTEPIANSAARVVVEMLRTLPD